MQAQFRTQIEPRTGAEAYSYFKPMVFTPIRKQEEGSEAERTSRQQGNDLLQLHILAILTEFHIGKDCAIKNKDLRIRLNATGEFNLSIEDSRPVRQAVNEMRKKGVPICSSSSHGYWWPTNYADTVSTTDELDHRARDIQYAKGQMVRGASAFFGRQELMELPHE